MEWCIRFFDCPICLPNSYLFSCSCFCWKDQTLLDLSVMGLTKWNSVMGFLKILFYCEIALNGHPLALTILGTGFYHISKCAAYVMHSYHRGTGCFKDYIYFITRKISWISFNLFVRCQPSNPSPSWTTQRISMHERAFKQLRFFLFVLKLQLSVLSLGKNSLEWRQKCKLKICF